MRSVLVSNSLSEQPQGHRPCKNLSCSTVQEVLTYDKKALLKSQSAAQASSAGLASPQAYSGALGRNKSVNSPVSAPPPEAARPRRGCSAAFNSDFLQLAPSVHAPPDVLTERAA